MKKPSIIFILFILTFTTLSAQPLASESSLASLAAEKSMTRVEGVVEDQQIRFLLHDVEDFEHLFGVRFHGFALETHQLNGSFHLATQSCTWSLLQANQHAGLATSSSIHFRDLNEINQLSLLIIFKDTYGGFRTLTMNLQYDGNQRFSTSSIGKPAIISSHTESLYNYFCEYQEE